MQMRKLLILPALVIAAYAAWPVAAAWQLRTAVKARDHATVESRVDWVTLRANLKQTVRANLTDESKSPEAGFFTRALKRTVGPVVADRVIDAAVTPRTLASVMAGRSLLDETGLTRKGGGNAPTPAPAPTSTSDADGDPADDPLAPRRLRWAFFESPTRFRIEAVDRRLPGKRVVSILALQGLSWKLVDVYYVTRE
ncbi:MAG: DUF2939 domain-containing protein [Hyphomicrobiaceae bacterium]|nr:MAG: DUF2939 domain-containing protein [Hyphomicrobiaceae bacterium]